MHRAADSDRGQGEGREFPYEGHCKQNYKAARANFRYIRIRYFFSYIERTNFLKNVLVDGR